MVAAETVEIHCHRRAVERWGREATQRVEQTRPHLSTPSYLRDRVRSARTPREKPRRQQAKRTEEMDPTVASTHSRLIHHLSLQKVVKFLPCHHIAVRRQCMIYAPNVTLYRVDPFLKITMILIDNGATDRAQTHDKDRQVQFSDGHCLPPCPH